MKPTMKSLGIDQLPRDAKLALVQEIWDNIAAESDLAPPGERCREELLRRLADDDARPEDVVAWEDVKAVAFVIMNRSAQ
jgi:putative addiction module component (TIGR02574 family)